MGRLEQLSGRQGVLVGSLRRGLRRALAIVVETVSAADLHTQAWYREAKAALGDQREPMNITRADLVVDPSKGTMRCKKCGETFCDLHGADLSRVEAEVEKALDTHECKPEEKKA